MWFKFWEERKSRRKREEIYNLCVPWFGVGKRRIVLVLSITWVKSFFLFLFYVWKSVPMRFHPSWGSFFFLGYIILIIFTLSVGCSYFLQTPRKFLFMWYLGLYFPSLHMKGENFFFCVMMIFLVLTRGVESRVGEMKERNKVVVERNVREVDYLMIFLCNSETSVFSHRYE